MSIEKVYLRGDVQFMPLIDQWYAWAFLISPASSAMFVANSHLKIMKSFVSAPEIHLNALKNPLMCGGPFINYDLSRVEEVKRLLAKTLKEQSHIVEFAEAVRSLNESLNIAASGSSLIPLYLEIPEPLKGFVELVYNLNNSPSIRFIEGLLFKSKYYDPSRQSIELSICEGDNRPFALSSPKLTDEKTFCLYLPFNSPTVDELFKMKTTPQPFNHIKEVLDVNNQDIELLSSFFTSKAPQKPTRYKGDSIKIRYLGHACLLIETKEISILVDPVISYENEEDNSRYTYADLPAEIDYLLITHSHQDHCLLETLLQIRHRIKNIIVPKSAGDGLIDPSLKLVLRAIGFTNIYEIDELESIETEDGLIIGIPFLGEHADLNIRSKIAYMIKLKGKSILCLADSNNIDLQLYKHLNNILGNVDILFLGMECSGGPLSWLYGPLLNKPISRNQDQSRRLNGSDFEGAIGIVDCFHPSQVYIYAMGLEPWLTHLTSINYSENSKQILESNKLVTECQKRGIISERLYGFKEIEI